MTTLRFAIAGSTNELNAFGRPEVLPRVLISYWYYESFARVREQLYFQDYVLDSGAFSAKHSGADIDLNEYIEFCLNLQKTDPLCKEIYALDVIGDYKETLKNTEKMWNAGIEAIPCYHLGEPWEALDYLAANYPKIALGGVALLRGKQKVAWAQYCFSRIWPKKVHGFACVTESILAAVPFHSVDATSWLGPLRFGQPFRGMRGHIKAIRGGKSYKSIQLEIDAYLKLEERIAHRWRKELELLEELDTNVRT